MLYIIDRFEGNFAVIELENGSHAAMPKVLLPSDAKEGDTLEIYVNQTATRINAKRNKELLSALFEEE